MKLKNRWQALLTFLASSFHDDARDNLQNALVVKSWSDEALNALWCELSSLRPLLGLLGTVVEGTKGDCVVRQYHLCQQTWIILTWRHFKAFEHPIQSSDWAIFNKYSSRVHHISISDPEIKYSDSIFIDISSSRPPSDLFPNLRSLYIISSLSHFLWLLVHKDLADLSIDIDNPQDAKKIKSVLTYLPDRCPNLIRLTLYALEEIPVDMGLDLVLPSLPHIKALGVSPRILTRPLLQAISRVPRIELLDLSTFNPSQRQEISYVLGLGSGPPGGPPFTISPLTPNRISSLKTLSLFQPFETVITLLESCKLDNLRELTIDRCSEPAEEWMRIFKAVRSCCPRLETMSLHRDASKMKSLANPFLTFISPTSLSTNDIPMDADTMIYIAKALPSIQQLSLTRSFRVRYEHTLPICVLAEVAPLFPHLSSLSIDVDTSPGALAHIGGGHVPFSRLEELDVSYSYLDSPAIEVATFLSGILKEACRLVRTSYDLRKDDVLYKSWQLVIDFLPILIRLRNAGRRVAAK